MCGGYFHSQRVSYEIFSGGRSVEDIFIHRGCPMKYLVVTRCVEDIFILRGCPTYEIFRGDRSVEDIFILTVKGVS